MIIRSLELSNYRNYESLNLTLDPGTNVFYGDNAQGKTNILEAVYLSCTSKSHRGSKDREIIRFLQEEAHIKLLAEKNGQINRIDIHLKQNKPKGIAVNKIPIRKISELFGIANIVFFSPEDLNLVKNGPAERRRFIDLELCQLDKIYTNDLSRYNQILNQRNKLLKNLDSKPEFFDTLQIWDMQMLSYGKKIIKAREEFIFRLNDIVRDIHKNLTGEREELKIVYAPNVRADQFENELEKKRESDIRQRMSLTGPHRDDIGFFVNGMDVRRYGSQGQQRTVALSLKLAEIELVKRLTGDTPILLLDDVLSELDGNRQVYLLKHMDHIQTLITCTGLDEFVGHCFHIDRSFQVRNGTVVCDSYREETDTPAAL